MRRSSSRSFRSSTRNALIALRDFREGIAHDGHRGRGLEPHVDGVNPGARIVAELDQILEVILEGDADALIHDGGAFRRHHHRCLIHRLRHQLIQIRPHVEAVQRDVVPIVVLQDPSISNGELDHALGRVNVELRGFQLGFGKGDVKIERTRIDEEDRKPGDDERDDDGRQNVRFRA